MKFIGREQEQKTIQRLMSKEGYQGCVIYGRRRMGKTELVRKCVLEKSPVVMYQCKESNEQDNVEMLTGLLRSVFNNPYLSFATFMDAVRFLFDYSKNQEIILVLDEYPYLKNLIDGCDSKLQSIIDDHAMNCNLKLFLLGSSISTMEDILSHDNPLYMRFQTSIFLRQMDYWDSAQFYPHYSNEDKVRMYAAFGGVPYFNAQIDDRISPKENIIRLLSGQFSGMKEFLDTYLKQELRKTNSANAVFEAVALGAFHYADILSKSRVESSPLLNSILQKLTKMDLVEYVSPINNKNDKQKSGYRISDSCVKFYYHFVYRNASAHALLDDDIFYEKFIHEDFEKFFVPKTFEEISKQFLIRLNKNGQLEPMLIDIGTYWYDQPSQRKNGQFDVVGKTEDGYAFFECKYTNSPLNDEVIKEELEQVASTTLKPVQYGFFSKNGFDLKNHYRYLLYSLEDLYR